MIGLDGTRNGGSQVWIKMDSNAFPWSGKTTPAEACYKTGRQRLQRSPLRDQPESRTVLAQGCNAHPVPLSCVVSGIQVEHSPSYNTSTDDDVGDEIGNKRRWKLLDNYNYRSWLAVRHVARSHYRDARMYTHGHYGSRTTFFKLVCGSTAGEDFGRAYPLCLDLE